MAKNILPIGTVVLLMNATKKVMITGFFQRTKEGDKLWDYAGCVYPEGYLDKEKMVLFDHGQIDKIIAVGYQDMEQFVFHDQLNKVLQSQKQEG